MTLLRGSPTPPPSPEALDLLNELTDVFELAIDRCKADVRYLIDLVKPLHNQLTNLSRRHFALRLLREAALNLIDNLLELDNADRPLLGRLEQSPQNLVPVEWFPASIRLNDHEVDLTDPLIGSEALEALLALASAANHRAILALTRIDDLFFETATVGTLHRRAPWRILRQVGRGEGKLLSV